MSRDLQGISAQIAQLRQSFDASFALPARTPGEDLLTVLVVRCGGMTQAVRISELLRVEPCPALIPLPAQHAAFLGLAALQGRSTAVFSLARLLSRESVPGDERWLLVAQCGLAVAVSRIQGCVRVRAEDPVRAGSDRLQPMVAISTGHCPLIELGELVHPLFRPSGTRRTTPQE